MNDPFAVPLDAASVVPESNLLDHWSLLVVDGADARTFLDSQLTRNVPAGASSESASLAGYCSPKGRLLADFVLWTDADAIRLLVSRDIAAPIARRLRMYVLRARVAIVDATDAHAIEGFEGTVGLDPWGVRVADGRTVIRFPDADGGRRHLSIRPLDAGTVDGAYAPAAWRWMDIRSGLPRITSGTQDRFVPQMLNLEALGGVDFRKGCFPGQEVVARSQYLGKLKRRMALATADTPTPPAPGTDVWNAAGGEPVGLVVNAERGADRRVAMLVELPLAQFDATGLRVGSADGPLLTLEPLPYALPDNEVFVRPKL